MHTVFALLCFVVVIHGLIFPYPSGLLHWHCGNLTIAPVPAKQPWWIWINTSCEFIMNDCITTTKQSTTKPCAYFLGYTVDAFDEYSHDSESRERSILRLFPSHRWSLFQPKVLKVFREDYFHRTAFKDIEEYHYNWVRGRIYLYKNDGRLSCK